MNATRLNTPPPLLIGQAPGPNTNPDAPLWPKPLSSTGGRLMELMGLGKVAYLRTFDRTNLLHTHPGQWEDKDRFPRVHARVAAQAMRPLLRGRPVIYVGRAVAEAFGHRELAFHTWDRCGQWRYRHAVIPHPSGRNRWYNAEANRLEAQAFWRAFLEDLSQERADIQKGLGFSTGVTDR